MLRKITIGWIGWIAAASASLSFAQSSDRGEELREAARSGNVAQVVDLLDRGTPVDAPGRHNVTPLRLAAERGQLEVVQLLLERGANLDANETFFGSSIVAAALNAKQREIALLVLEKGAADRIGALNWAIEQDDFDLAKAALTDHPIDAFDLAVAKKSAAEKSAALRELLDQAQVAPRGAKIALRAEELARLSGKYRSRNQTVEVSVVADGLSAKIGDAEAITLVPIGPNRFETEAGDVRLEFSGRAKLIEWATLVRADGDATFLSAAFVPEPDSLQAAKDVSLTTAPRGAGKPWRQFRGEFSSGIGDGQGAPADWDVAAGRNIRFKTPIPGIGLSSPIIDSGRIFVTTAISSKGDTTFRTGLYGDGTSVDDVSLHSFRLYALDAKDGSILWDREVANVSPTVKRHLKSSLANSTPASDGQRIVTLFGMIGVLAAYDWDGNEIWRRDIGVLDSNDPQSGSAEWGHASSPVIWNDLVFVQADRRRDSFLAAYRLSDGEEVWRVERTEPSTWSTPTIVASENGDELVTNGTTIRAYRPETGELLWSLGPNSEVVVATPITHGGMIYITAGYPPVRPVYAIRAGSRGALSLAKDQTASPAVAWSHDRGGTYLPTPILYRNHLITLNNNGVLTAYRADTGEEAHRARVGGSNASFSASPVAADGRIYLATEDGNVFVIRGEPGFEILATHASGEIVMATPAISDGLLVLRTLHHVIGIADDTPSE